MSSYLSWDIKRILALRNITGAQVTLFREEVICFLTSTDQVFFQIYEMSPWLRNHLDAIRSLRGVPTVVV